MSLRKISDCINVRINVGNYQHIELTKYAEEQIEYATEAERIAKEDRLVDELVASMKRSLNVVASKLKGGESLKNVTEVEESISKRIPEWLENDPVPNIANKALSGHNKSTATQYDEKSKPAASDNILPDFEEKDAKLEVAESSGATEEVEASEDINLADYDGDLFEDDDVAGVDAIEEAADYNKKTDDKKETKSEKKEKVEKKEEKAQETVVPEVAKKDDFFDDDFFDDK
jgi:hypothetical protein